VLRAVREVQSAAGHDGDAPREIRIGVAHALTEVTLTEPVDRLRRAFPRVTLALATGWSRDLLERVRAGSLEAAVILLPEGERLPAGLDAVAVGRERLVVVEPRRAHRTRAGGLAGLDGAGWVLNPDGCAARAMLGRILHRARVRMRVAVETYTYELQLALVGRGRGLGLVPARILARSRLRSRLRVRRVPDLEFPLTIWWTGASGITSPRITRESSAEARWCLTACPSTSSWSVFCSPEATSADLVTGIPPLSAMTVKFRRIPIRIRRAPGVRARTFSTANAVSST